MTKTKSKKSVAPQERERNRILKKMPEPLQAVAKRMDRSAAAAAKGLLRFQYKDGQVYAAVIADNAKYGANAVELLAEYRGCSANDIYTLRNFAERYTLEQVDELFGEVMAGGRPWSIKHVQQLIAIESEKQHDKLYKICREKGLSANALAAQVSATAKKTHTRAGGRKPARPTSIPAGAQQMVKKTAELMNRMPVWNEDVLDGIKNLPPGDFTDTLAQDLATQLQNSKDLRADLLKQEKDIDKYLQRYDRISGKGDSKPKSKKKKNPGVTTSKKTKATARPKAKKQTKKKHKKATARA